jgi:hypothetical protein
VEGVPESGYTLLSLPHPAEPDTPAQATQKFIDIRTWPYYREVCLVAMAGHYWLWKLLSLFCGKELFFSAPRPR